MLRSERTAPRTGQTVDVRLEDVAGGKPMGEVEVILQRVRIERLSTAAPTMTFFSPRHDLETVSRSSWEEIWGFIAFRNSCWALR